MASHGRLPAVASPPGGKSSPGPARAASPRGRIVSRGSRAPTTGPRRRRRRRSERVARIPCARSLGSLGPSGKAAGDAQLHSPASKPTLTEAPETGRSRKNGQARRLQRKTRADGWKRTELAGQPRQAGPGGLPWLRSARRSPATLGAQGPTSPNWSPLVAPSRRQGGGGGRGRVARRRRRDRQRRGPVGSCR